MFAMPIRRAADRPIVAGMIGGVPVRRAAHRPAMVSMSRTGEDDFNRSGGMASRVGGNHRLRATAARHSEHGEHHSQREHAARSHERRR